MLFLLETKPSIPCSLSLPGKLGRDLGEQQEKRQKKKREELETMNLLFFSLIYLDLLGQIRRSARHPEKQKHSKINPTAQ